MEGLVDTGLGKIAIDTDVIATYAGSVAVECFGIVGMAAVSMKDGLVKLLKRDSLKHGINVGITDNKITLEFHVIVAYGVSISAGETPDQFAADAYDGVHAVVEALKEAGLGADADPTEVAEKLPEAMRNITVDGLTGKLSWNDKGQVQKDPTAYVITDGKYVQA